MHPLYYIKVISDRWVCPDNVLPLSFRSIILPSKFSPPSEVLDLQSLPASSLDPIARDLKISYLNQVQTQAYHSFINSTENVFLGAAEGSGKFTLAILAMNQALQNHKKVVVVVSHQVIAQKRCQHLSKIFSKKKVARTFEDLNTDIQILAGADLIVTTPESWDVLTRRWKSRKGFI
jgi:pre-mRNA-splicing helicase BRR2